ncbi:hypothetical protein [Amycolatopsis samaneae]|uniref:Uncharacterized protein n=1 Tax=Amycolatopsis samaneae TaxID=664691 RepID=A0ABW5GER3_9PSEU
METSAGRMTATVNAWLATVVDASQSVRSVHFDELGVEGWQSPAATEIPGCWLELIELAVATLQARKVRGITVGVVAPLKNRDTVPMADRERSWKLLAASLHEIEPPSLYVFSSGALREWDLDVEEHRFPLLRESGVDHVFVRYWRDAEEIVTGDEYSGAVYLLRRLEDGPES